MTTGHLNLPKLPIHLPEAHIAAFCKKWQITELALFGSVLRNDFKASSDVNVLISFDRDRHYGLFEIAEMEAELEALLGRKVMVLTRRGVELSSNPLRRKQILETAEVIYADS